MKLFDMDPWKRMGMAQCEICNIEDHPFFRPINWKDVEELRMEPPFVPQVVSMLLFYPLEKGSSFRSSRP